MKESIRIPIKTPVAADFKGVFFNENGNNQMTGQHGDIPFILSQSGEEINKTGKQIAVKNINSVF